jgi:hypothetical protein
MPTVDGNTNYGKLTQIIEVEYYDRIRYVLFKCDWANITKSRKYKVDEYGLTFVNFKNLIHTIERETDDSYVLTNQVAQVFYVEDKQNLDWACAVRTKPRNVCDICQGQGINDECDNYHESELLNMNINHTLEDDIQCFQDEIPPSKA